MMIQKFFIVALLLLAGCGTESERVVVPARPLPPPSPVSVANEKREVVTPTPKVKVEVPAEPVVAPVVQNEPVVILPEPKPVDPPVVKPPPVAPAPLVKSVPNEEDTLVTKITVRQLDSALREAIEAIDARSRIQCLQYGDQPTFLISSKTGKSEVEIYNLPLTQTGDEVTFGKDKAVPSLVLNLRGVAPGMVSWASTIDSQTHCTLSYTRDETRIRGEFACTQMGSFDRSLPLLDLKANFQCYFRP